MLNQKNRLQTNIGVLLVGFVLLTGVLACGLGGSDANQEVDSEDLTAIQAAFDSAQALSDAAQQEPHPQPTEPPVIPDVTFGGVSFSFDDTLAAQVNPEIIPAATDPDMPDWAIYPEYVEFSFEGYVLADTFHEARILVYPVAEYQGLIEYVGEVVADLEWLLAERPAVPVDALPFLPMWNAGALIETQISYLVFQNGSGVRSLTQHGQSWWPINNTDLFYTFQGLTADGAFYVVGIFPISSPILLNSGDDYAMDNYDFFAENFENYTNDIASQLNAQLGDSYNPALDLLDALFQSLLVE